MPKGKWLFFAGLGTGAALALRLSEKQIGNIKGFASKIAQSENLHEAKRVASAKLGDVLRQQGANLVDRVADNLKQQLNPFENKPGFSSTTTTDKDGKTRDKDGHVIIDGKIVS